jgi:hypothetical protein
MEVFDEQGQSDLRDRYAEFFKQLFSGSLPTHFPLLQKFLPHVVDVINNDTPAEAVIAAFDAIHHLVNINTERAVKVLSVTHFTASLVKNLGTTSNTALRCSLRTLAFITAHAQGGYLCEVEMVTPKLLQLLTQATTSTAVYRECALLVAMLCRRGEDCVQRLVTSAPAIFDSLFASLIPFVGTQLQMPILNLKSPNSALALMHAAQNGSNAHLSMLLQKGLYSVAFKTLTAFAEFPNLLVQTMKALLRVVQKISNLQTFQDAEPGFRADRGWGRVRALSQSPGHSSAGTSHSVNATVSESSGGEEQESISALEDKVRRWAAKLYAAATERKLVPNTFYP